MKKVGGVVVNKAFVFLKTVGFKTPIARLTKRDNKNCQHWDEKDVTHQLLKHELQPSTKLDDFNRPMTSELLNFRTEKILEKEIFKSELFQRTLVLKILRKIYEFNIISLKKKKGRGILPRFLPYSDCLSKDVCSRYFVQCGSVKWEEQGLS